MMFFYNSEIPVGDSVISFRRFIGGPNTGLPNASPVIVLFVKGASVSMKIELQTAAVPTPLDQVVVIEDDDWITAKTYNEDTGGYVEYDTPLYGLWVRFKVTNTGIAGPITVSLT